MSNYSAESKFLNKWFKLKLNENTYVKPYKMATKPTFIRHNKYSKRLYVTFNYITIKNNIKIKTPIYIDCMNLDNLIEFYTPVKDKNKCLMLDLLSL